MTLNPPFIEPCSKSTTLGLIFLFTHAIYHLK
jgi:hypothetical protein